MRIRKGSNSNKSNQNQEGPGPVAPVLAHVHKPSRRTDAGGAYFVLPVGLVAQLPHETQQQLVDIADQLGRMHPEWAHTVTYQVLPWARYRPADLSPQELSWYGIVQDMDPVRGEVGYFRSGTPLPPDHAVGYRPTLDKVPVLPGTHPGARPPLLPSMPNTQAPGAGHQAVATNIRAARAAQVATIQQRVAALHAADPSVDHTWAQGIATADELWGPDQRWRTLLQNTTTAPHVDVRRPTPAEAPPRPVPAPAAAPTPPAAAAQPQPNPSTAVHPKPQQPPRQATAAAPETPVVVGAAADGPSAPEPAGEPPADDLSAYQEELEALEADLSHIFRPGNSQ